MRRIDAAAVLCAALLGAVVIALAGGRTWAGMSAAVVIESAYLWLVAPRMRARAQRDRSESGTAPDARLTRKS